MNPGRSMNDTVETREAFWGAPSRVVYEGRDDEDNDEEDEEDDVFGLKRET